MNSDVVYGNKTDKMVQATDIRRDGIQVPVKDVVANAEDK